ncbi:hypothetical protein D3C80_2182960 [compost metagenome]
MPSQLMFYYLQRAPVSESFLVRRWLYGVWEAAGRLIHTGKLDRQLFDHASKQLLPWLAD